MGKQKCRAQHVQLSSNEDRSCSNSIHRRSWAVALAALRGEVAKGRRTLVTIQFGHNDQKIAPASSMAANLTVMVRQVRAAGGEPVLVTSLTRRSFNSNGTVADLLKPWADGTRLTSILCELSLKYWVGIISDETSGERAGYACDRLVGSFDQICEQCFVLAASTVLLTLLDCQL